MVVTVVGVVICGVDVAGSGGIADAGGGVVVDVCSCVVVIASLCRGCWC